MPLSYCYQILDHLLSRPVADIVDSTKSSQKEALKDYKKIHDLELKQIELVLYVIRDSIKKFQSLRKDYTSKLKQIQSLAMRLIKPPRILKNLLR